MLRLTEGKQTRRVSPGDVQDYRTFQSLHVGLREATEFQIFERFYGARLLLERGLTTYLDPLVSAIGEETKTKVDVGGSSGNSLTIVSCQAERMDPSLANIIHMIDQSRNAQAIILMPSTIHDQRLQQLLPQAINTGRVDVESLGWFEDQFGTTLRDTLRLIDLLGNETRIRMLTPLFRKVSAKREYRATINPKLVYQNLPLLLEAGLIDEHEGNYQLSEMGKTILAEFITFLEKTRKTLDLASKQRR